MTNMRRKKVSILVVLTAHGDSFWGNEMEAGNTKLAVSPALSLGFSRSSQN